MTEYIWNEKYRPKTINECILPNQLRELFTKMVQTNNVQNMTFTGTSGIGKTTVAKALLEECGYDYIVINGSLEGRSIDTLRTEISDFAGTVSLSGNRKFVLIDEADGLNAQSIQGALRAFMEEVSSNCGFILTCNFKNKLIPQIYSRCPDILFSIPKNENATIAKEYLKRLEYILTEEGITYDRKVLASLIVKAFPDFRRVINDCQRYSILGSIDTGILTKTSNDNINQLVEHLKDKNFDKVKKWVAENYDYGIDSIISDLYSACHTTMKRDTVPAFVLAAAEYQYKAAFVANPEINIIAFLTELMVSVEFV